VWCGAWGATHPAADAELLVDLKLDRETMAIPTETAWHVVTGQALPPVEEEKPCENHAIAAAANDSRAVGARTVRCSLLLSQLRHVRSVVRKRRSSELTSAGPRNFERALLAVVLRV